MDTSSSFLEALRQGPDDEAWTTLVRAYGPLLSSWLIRGGLAFAEVDDVVQEVLIVVVRRLPEFRRAPHTGAFRGWLRSITANCLRDHWRRQQRRPASPGGTDFGAMVEQLADPSSGLSREWDRQHDAHILNYLMERIRPEFTEKTWRMFQLFTLEGQSADEVCRQLGGTPNAVFVAKSRVLARLRQIGAELIE